MSHSLLKIWIHGIFSTKERTQLIKSEFEREIYTHIKNKFENEMECKVRIINGMPDHVHILFLLSPNYSIADIFKSVKGESSHWINESNFIKEKFTWQTGYGAFSVSESRVEEVEKYIRNQKEHHKKKSYSEEIELFIKKYKLSVVNR